MAHFYKIFLLVSFSCIYANAQESFKAKLLDSISKEPIPFAAISLNNNTGVISNENGYFQLYLPKKISQPDSIFIQCMGYETKPFSALKLKDSIIILNPKSIELKEVLISK